MSNLSDALTTALRIMLIPIAVITLFGIIAISQGATDLSYDDLFKVSVIVWGVVIGVITLILHNHQNGES